MKCAPVIGLSNKNCNQTPNRHAFNRQRVSIKDSNCTNQKGNWCIKLSTDKTYDIVKKSCRSPPPPKKTPLNLIVRTDLDYKKYNYWNPKNVRGNFKRPPSLNLVFG